MPPPMPPMPPMPPVIGGGGYEYVTGLRSPQLQCQPSISWPPSNQMPSYGVLQPAGMALLGQELNLPIFVQWSLFGLATVVGYKAVKRAYARAA
jgi:hypothetical protein